MGEEYYKYTEEECIDYISATTLFSIDKEEKAILYEREEYKLIEHLWYYLLHKDQRIAEEYGEEAWQCIRRCIKSFNPEKSDAENGFLAYFRTAWRNEKAKIKKEEMWKQSFSGAPISKNERLLIKHYLYYYNRCGDEKTEEEKYALIAERLHKTVDEIREIAKMRYIASNPYLNIDDEGEDKSSFEFADDSFSDCMKDKADIEELFDEWNKLYEDLQERQKPLFSEWITNGSVEALGPDTVEQYLNEYVFLNAPFFQEIKQNGKVYTQREFAERHKMAESNLSRTISGYKKRYNMLIQ